MVCRREGRSPDRRHTTRRQRERPGGRIVQAAQTVVPVAVTASDKIESLRQWAFGRCLPADRAGVYTRPEVGGGRRRRVIREPGVNERQFSAEGSKPTWNLLPSRAPRHAALSGLPPVTPFERPERATDEGEDAAHARGVDLGDGCRLHNRHAVHKARGVI